MRKVVLTEELELTDAQREQLRQARNRIPGTDDIPERPEANWATARRLYKPRKEAISLRLDADVLEWLRGRSERYQTEINRLLRALMEAETTR